MKNTSPDNPQEEIQHSSNLIPNVDHATELLAACWQSNELFHQIGTLDRQAGGFKNKSVADVNKAVHLAQEFSSQGIDTYFALAEYETPNSRKADNTVGACCFWMDIDCGEDKAGSGKGYLNKEEALDALADFCKDAGIPKPTYIIDSGNGLHAYWALDGQLERNRWLKYANNLKELTHQLAFKADDSRTADIASVLRIPGTLNHKGSPARPVTVIEATSDRIGIDSMLSAIKVAHQRLLIKPEKEEMVASVTNLPMVTNVLPMSTSNDPELKKLKSALSVLDPDCSEGEWKLKRLAPLASLAMQHPEHAEKIKLLARKWSRGDLQNKSSKKWLTQGNISGLTGQESFEAEWQRFLSVGHSANHATVGTIYHDAKKNGWVDDNLTKLAPLAVMQEIFGLIKMSGKIWVIDKVAIKKAKHLELFDRTNGSLLIIRKATALFGAVVEHILLKEFFISNETTCFDGVEFNPVKTTDNYLNLWVGPALNALEGDCVGIKAFLLDIICNGDDTSYQYLLNYIAHMIQKPEEKPGVMLILLGGQGIGKGTLGRLLQMIWKESYLQVHSVDAVTGNFNAALEKAFIVFMDEALFSGDRRSADALKSLVTEPTIYINEKHQPARQMESYHRFIAATNADHFKNTESDDRRDFVLRVSDSRKNDPEYWLKLNDEMTNGGVEALLYELEKIDLTDFNVRVKPTTEALIDQKLRSLDHFGRWWYECLDKGYCQCNSDLQLGAYDKGNAWPEFISTVDAIEDIKEVSGGRIFKMPIARDVQQAFTKLCPSAMQRQRLVDGSRKRGLVLPSLEQSRTEFETYLGGRVDWSIEEDAEIQALVEDGGSKVGEIKGDAF
jgi:hypothetical protein